MRKGLINAAAVKADFESLNSTLHIDEQVTPERNAKGNITKECYVDALIKVRQKLIAADPDWASNRRSEFTSAAVTTSATYSERVNDELDMIEYTFRGTAVRTVYETKKHKIKPIDGSGETGQMGDARGMSPEGQQSPTRSDHPGESQDTTLSTPSLTAGFGVRDYKHRIDELRFD